VNHNVSASIHAQISCAFSVAIIWVLHMQCSMESTVSLVTVYYVKAFWSLVVTLTLFWLHSSSANGNCVGMNDGVAVIEQQKSMFAL